MKSKEVFDTMMDADAIKKFVHKYCNIFAVSKPEKLNVSLKEEEKKEKKEETK